MDKLKIRFVSKNGKLEIMSNRECNLERYVKDLIHGFIHLYVDDFNLLNKKLDLLETVKSNVNGFDMDITLTENLPTYEDLMMLTNEEWFEKNRTTFFTFDNNTVDDLLLLDIRLRFYEIYGNNNVKAVPDKQYNKTNFKQMN